MAVRPLKGAHLTLNEEVLNWIRTVLDDMSEYYSDELADNRPGDILADLQQAGWKFEDDKFGMKVYKTVPYNAGPNVRNSVLRITVVMTKNKELKLDIRPWGDIS